MKYAKIYLAIPAILITGCIAKPIDNSTQKQSSTSTASIVKNEPSEKEILEGATRIMAVIMGIEEGITLTDIKKIFSDGFVEESRRYNPETNCNEYQVLCPLLEPVLMNLPKCYSNSGNS